WQSAQRVAYRTSPDTQLALANCGVEVAGLRAQQLRRVAGERPCRIALGDHPDGIAPQLVAVEVAHATTERRAAVVVEDGAWDVATAKSSELRPKGPI